MPQRMCWSVSKREAHNNGNAFAYDVLLKVTVGSCGLIVLNVFLVWILVGLFQWWRHTRRVSYRVLLNVLLQGSRDIPWKTSVTSHNYRPNCAVCCGTHSAYEIFKYIALGPYCNMYTWYSKSLYLQKQKVCYAIMETIRVLHTYQYHAIPYLKTE